MVLAFSTTACKTQNMKNRSFWFRKVEESWQHGNAVWFSGLPSSGKSLIAQNLPQVEYFDCTLPSVRRALEHPLEFFARIGEGRVVFDEITRIVNPIAIISLARQVYPQIRILATSSSSLALVAAEKDLTEERIEELWLTPMVSADLSDFLQHDLQQRFLRGGLPPFFLAEGFPEREFQQWMDDFWFNSIQNMFRLEKKASLQKFAEMLMIDSGQIFEATRYAEPCGVSRTTITNYLSVLEKTYFANLLRPFNSRRSTEIIAAPKVYGFDTGFVAFHRGWNQLRRSDLGTMWKHFVLNELHASLQTRQFYYWRDKRNHEVDFIFARRIHTPTAIDCSWSSSDYDPTGLQAFRRQYPSGENLIVCHDVTQPFIRTYRKLTAKFVPLNQIVDELVS